MSCDNTKRVLAQINVFKICKVKILFQSCILIFQKGFHVSYLFSTNFNVGGSDMFTLMKKVVKLLRI